MNEASDIADESAQKSVFGSALDSEVFDCVINVYNNENKVVATMGWTELSRKKDIESAVPINVKRYGCY